MGNRSSTQPNSEMPKSFYVVQGSPHIRYRHDTNFGPIIYQAEMASTAGETMVERADSLSLTAAVPSKQPFLLTPRADGPSNSADLSFDIFMVKPIKRLSVLANVAVAYVEKKGLVLRSVPEHPHQPPCVYESRTLDASTSRITTSSPIFYATLTSAAFSTTISAERKPEGEQVNGPAAQYITRAPLVIILELPDVDSRDLPHFNTKAAQNNEEDSARPHGEQTDVEGNVEAADTRASVTPAPPARVLQFTFLDIGRQDERTGHSIAPAPAAPTSRRFEDQPITLKAVKQLLQIGAEVYELDDIFDLGDNGLIPSAAAEDGRELSDAPAVIGGSDDDVDDGNLCVVCLSNAKDTVILPCRHMCVCHECAAQLRLNNNKCPICRCNIERVLTM